MQLSAEVVEFLFIPPALLLFNLQFLKYLILGNLLFLTRLLDNLFALVHLFDIGHVSLILYLVELSQLCLFLLFEIESHLHVFEGLLFLDFVFL